MLRKSSGKGHEKETANDIAYAYEKRVQKQWRKCGKSADLAAKTCVKDCGYPVGKRRISGGNAVATGVVQTGPKSLNPRIVTLDIVFQPNGTTRSCGRPLDIPYTQA